MSKTGKSIFLAGVAVLAMSQGAITHAQTAAPAPDVTPAKPASAPEDTREDIIVTGSRIARRDFSSDSPIATVSGQEIQKSGLVNLEDALNQLPQFVQGNGTFSLGRADPATINLRGLGDNRNLVLLDGRRLPSLGPSGAVTTDIIPTAAIENIEIITGGASSVYGSDALSGVVNFKTLKNFSGVKVDAQYGNSFKGDLVPAKQVSVTAGLSGDRGNALFSFSYLERGGFFGYQRPFFFLQSASSFLSTSLYAPSAGNLPSQAALNTAFSGAPAGTVLPTYNLGFNDNGSLFSQTGATNFLYTNKIVVTNPSIPPALGPASSIMDASNQYGYVIIGGNVRESSCIGCRFITPEQRFSAFGKFDYVLGGVTAYGQVLYVHDRLTGATGGGINASLALSPDAVNVTVPMTNPFIPASLRAVLVSRPNPAAPFSFTTRFSSLPVRDVTTTADTGQVLLGARGKLPVGNWTWDIYGSYSQVSTTSGIVNGVRISRVNTLLNALDGGNSICAGGYNPFGRANNLGISQACAKYLLVSTASLTDQRMHVVEASATGDVFKLPAGPVKAAITLDYRRDAVHFTPAPIAQDGDIYVVAPPGGLDGTIAVEEASIELAVPVLADIPFVRSLDTDFGYRYSDYNLAGGVSTYKASAIWKVAGGFSLRAGYEHAVRAPNLMELYANGSNGAGGAIGFPPNGGEPCDVRSTARAGPSGAQIATLCVATGVPVSFINSYQYPTSTISSLTSGSRNLKPETAKTITAGAVLQPKSTNAFLRGFSATVDYYNIKITNLISILTAPEVLAKCYNIDGSNPTYAPANQFCQQLRRDPTNGNLISVTLSRANFGALQTSGVDVQLMWSIGADDIGLSSNLGHFSIRTQLNFLGSYRTQLTTGAPYVERRGTIDINNNRPLPKWQAFTTFDYTVGPIDIGLNWRHLPKIVDVTTVTAPASPLAPTGKYDLFDLNVGISLTSKISLRAGIRNLFDRDPQIVTGNAGTTLAGTYDIIGRNYFLSLKARM
jgi:iron complex outermembrane receptor protein